MPQKNNMRKNIYPRICKECNSSFLGGPRAWYCPQCREERIKEKKKEYNLRQRNGITRKIGTWDTCLNCGVKYIIRGSLQKYCSDCAPKVIAEIDRKQGIDYYNANKDKINPVRMVARRKLGACEICGKEISSCGRRRFCLDCEREGKRNLLIEPTIDRNITKRGNSYIVHTCFDKKSYYIKSTKKYDTAIRLRDFAAVKAKEPDFLEWLDNYKKSGRPLI